MIIHLKNSKKILYTLLPQLRNNYCPIPSFVRNMFFRKIPPSKTTLPLIQQLSAFHPLEKSPISFLLSLQKGDGENSSSPKSFGFPSSPIFRENLGNFLGVCHPSSLTSLFLSLFLSLSLSLPLSLTDLSLLNCELLVPCTPSFTPYSYGNGQ